MYTALLSGRIPGTVSTKKYPGNRAYHKGAFGSPPKHGHEKPYVAKYESSAETPAQFDRDENFYHGMELEAA
jgi:hypothetical protein